MKSKNKINIPVYITCDNINGQIYERVLGYVENKEYKKDDLVLVDLEMWDISLNRYVKWSKIVRVVKITTKPMLIGQIEKMGEYR